MDIYVYRVKTGMGTDERGRLDPTTGYFLPDAYIDMLESIQVQTGTQMFVETRHRMFFRPGKLVTGLKSRDNILIYDKSEENQPLGGAWIISGETTHNTVGVPHSSVEIWQDVAA